MVLVVGPVSDMDPTGDMPTVFRRDVRPMGRAVVVAEKWHLEKMEGSRSRKGEKVSKGSAGAITNTRGLFNHGAGKGDKPREVNRKLFDAHFDEIKWGPDNDKKKLVVKQGARTVIIYK